MVAGGCRRSFEGSSSLWLATLLRTFRSSWQPARMRKVCVSRLGISRAAENTLWTSFKVLWRFVQVLRGTGVLLDLEKQQPMMVKASRKD